MPQITRYLIISSLFMLLLSVLGSDVSLAADVAVESAAPVTKVLDNHAEGTWLWPALLFLISIGIGVAAALTGVGGAVLFVPIVSCFFPYNIDFVRGAGLFIALTGALYAGPSLLKLGLADLRLALPMALVSSIFAYLGAIIGLRLPTHVIQTFLGITILMIVVLMITAKTAEFPVVKTRDKLSKFLGISGIFYEGSSNEHVEWQIHRTLWGLVSFAFIGFLAGLFGLGAGWANVPVLNSVLGVPLKLAVGTSKFILSITDTSAGWVYLNSGGVVPLIVIPSVFGMIIGTRIGVKLLPGIKPKKIKWFVIGLLAAAGLMSLLKGLDTWH